MTELALSCKLVKIDIGDILPLTLLNNKEESLCQKVLEAEVSEIRTLGVRDDPVPKAVPNMKAIVAAVVGMFVKLRFAAAPRL